MHCLRRAHGREVERVDPERGKRQYRDQQHDRAQDAMKAQRHEAMNAGGAAVRRLAIVPAALGQPLDHHDDEQDAQRRDEGVVVGQEPEG